MTQEHTQKRVKDSVLRTKASKQLEEEILEDLKKADPKLLEKTLSELFVGKK